MWYAARLVRHEPSSLPSISRRRWAPAPSSRGMTSRVRQPLLLIRSIMVCREGYPPRVAQKSGLLDFLRKDVGKSGVACPGGVDSAVADEQNRFTVKIVHIRRQDFGDPAIVLGGGEQRHPQIHGGRNGFHNCHNLMKFTGSYQMKRLHDTWFVRFMGKALQSGRHCCGFFEMNRCAGTGFRNGLPKVEIGGAVWFREASGDENDMSIHNR